MVKKIFYFVFFLSTAIAAYTYVKVKSFEPDREKLDIVNKSFEKLKKVRPRVFIKNEKPILFSGTNDETIQEYKKKLKKYNKKEIKRLAELKSIQVELDKSKALDDYIDKIGPWVLMFYKSTLVSFICFLIFLIIKIMNYYKKAKQESKRNPKKAHR